MVATRFFHLRQAQHQNESTSAAENPEAARSSGSSGGGGGGGGKRAPATHIPTPRLPCVAAGASASSSSSSSSSALVSPSPCPLLVPPQETPPLALLLQSTAGRAAGGAAAGAGSMDMRSGSRGRSAASCFAQSQKIVKDLFLKLVSDLRSERCSGREQTGDRQAAQALSERVHSFTLLLINE